MIAASGAWLLAGLFVGESPALSAKDEVAVQAVALNHYFAKHPPARGDALCIAVTGYKSPGKELRNQLRNWKLDREPKCHFREGRLVYSVVGPVATEDRGAEIEISQLQFGDVSMSHERVSYRLAGNPKWAVTSERPAQ